MLLCLTEEFKWWYEGIHCKSLPEPDWVINTDSSNYAYGAVMNDSNTTGMWNEEEKSLHFNVLQIKASFIGVKALCKHFCHGHLRIVLHNSTVVAYINNMYGTHSLVCDAL